VSGVGSSDDGDDVVAPPGWLEAAFQNRSRFSDYRERARVVIAHRVGQKRLMELSIEEETSEETLMLTLSAFRSKIGA
jgi:hypothetical protein